MAAKANVVVLNQTNTLHSVGLYGRERKLLCQGNLWHKIIIHHVSTQDREKVLKTLLQSVQSLDLIPVNYKIEGNHAHFIARNCGPAIEKLCRDNLVVQNKNGAPYILTVVLGYSNTSQTQLNVQDNICSVLRKRFNTQTKILDLDNFHKDEALSEVVFCILSQPKILYYVLHLCKSLNPHGIRFANNELQILEPLESLWNFKNLTILDLRDNLIENMLTLRTLKSMDLKELWLDGNPVCKNYNEYGYVQAVKELFPGLEKLDGTPVGCNGFPAFRRNYCVTPNSARFADQFLKHFFTIYDSNRSQLELLYHQNALFSLSCSHISGTTTSSTTNLTVYKQHSRNLLKLSDFSKSNEQVNEGRANIMKKLNELPPTQHDPYTFTVDAVYYRKEAVTMTITGAFCDPVNNLAEPECLYGFLRSFILVPGENGEYNILNDMLHVTNATNSLGNRSFKMVRVPKPETMLLPKPGMLSELDDNVAALSKISTLNKDWSRKCLVEAQWDLKKALEIFVDAYKSEKLPEEAFQQRWTATPSMTGGPAERDTVPPLDLRTDRDAATPSMTGCPAERDTVPPLDLRTDRDAATPSMTGGPAERDTVPPVDLRTDRDAATTVLARRRAAFAQRRAASACRKAESARRKAATARRKAASAQRKAAFAQRKAASARQEPAPAQQDGAQPEASRQIISDTADLCWRCGEAGHRRFACKRPSILFCSRCLQPEVMSRNCLCGQPVKAKSPETQAE